MKLLKKNNEDKIPLSHDQYGCFCHPFNSESLFCERMPYTVYTESVALYSDCLEIVS